MKTHFDTMFQKIDELKHLIVEQMERASPKGGINQGNQNQSTIETVYKSSKS